MQTIDIKKQQPMRLSRALTMTLHGIRYRLFRASVTVMVIAVAVAFLMNVACESVVTAQVSRVTQERVREVRTLARWVARLSTVPSQEELLRNLVAATDDAALTREIEAMSGLSVEAQRELRAAGREAVRYLDFFDGLTYADARRLVHRSRGVGIFERLHPATRRDEFQATLGTMRTVRFPVDVTAFFTFLDDWPHLRAELETIRAGRESAIQASLSATGPQPVLASLAAADGAFGETLRRAGFELPPEQAADIARRATDALEARLLAESLTDPDLRGAVAAHLDVLPTAVDDVALWRLLDDERRAAWFRERLAAANHAAAAMPTARLVELARLEQQNRRLLLAEQRMGAVDTGGFAGLSQRMTWLLLVSVFVCMVGIANAMLMAVTERFREIATLKCLGALDGTIMVMFVIEASLLGLAGGVMGAVLGLLIGLGRMTVQFWGLLAGAIPWGGLAGAMGASLLLGIVLAAVASIYPSLKAAHLAPMEAMRIE